jgi:hypothetical protein
MRISAGETMHESVSTRSGSDGAGRVHRCTELRRPACAGRSCGARRMRRRAAPLDISDHGPLARAVRVTENVPRVPGLLKSVRASSFHSTHFPFSPEAPPGDSLRARVTDCENWGAGSLRFTNAAESSDPYDVRAHRRAHSVALRRTSLARPRGMPRKCVAALRGSHRRLAQLGIRIASRNPDMPPSLSWRELPWRSRIRIPRLSFGPRG